MNIIVIAGSYDSYMDVLKEENLTPREAKFVVREAQLSGLHNVRILYADDAYLSPVWKSPLLSQLRQEIQEKCDA